MAFALKKIHIYILGAIAVLLAFVMSGYSAELVHAVLVIAIAFFAYTMLTMAADRYGA